MSNEINNEINAVIDNLCQKLGTSAAYLIPEFAKKEIAETAVTLILAVLIGMILVYLMKRIAKRMEGELIDIEDGFFFFIFPGFVLLVDSVVIMVFARNLAGWIASPTAKAIEKIAEMIK